MYVADVAIHALCPTIDLHVSQPGLQAEEPKPVSSQR